MFHMAASDFYQETPGAFFVLFCSKTDTHVQLLFHSALLPYPEQHNKQPKGEL